MAKTNDNAIIIDAKIDAPMDKVWEFWTGPEHIVKWNNASDDWHSPRAENDLREGGKFVFHMAAKDGSASFDFEGKYEKVEEHKLIAYVLADDRRVEIKFEESGDQTQVTETFDPENENSIDMQKNGWQSILDNFKKYCEENK